MLVFLVDAPRRSWPSRAPSPARRVLGRFGLGPRHLGRGRPCASISSCDAISSLDALLRDGQRIEHVGLGDLERATLDHHDRVVGRGDDDVHVAEAELLECRIEHPLAVHPANAHAGDRPLQRDLRRVERVGRGDKCQNVGVIHLVRGDDVDEHLDFVLEALGKERPIERSMIRAFEDLRVVRPPFALDEAARDLSGGVGLFLVLDREREERQRTLLVADGDGGEHHRVAELDDGRACGLLRHASRLDAETATREGPFNALHYLFLPLGHKTRGRTSCDPRGWRRLSELVPDSKFLDELPISLDVRRRDN